MKVLRGNSRRRAFTLFEMLISMFIMGLVMSFAALEFKDVVFTYLDVDSHLSSEQQARVAIAKVNDIARQASVVDQSQNPVPPVVQPASTAGPILEFTKAESIDPTSMPTPGGVPDPCYDDVSIFVVPDAVVPNNNPIDQPHNLVERVVPQNTSRIECTSGKQPLPLHLIARDVQAFTVEKIEPCAPNDPKCSQFGQGYRIDISVFDYDDHKADNHSGSLYHLTSVITPLTFGKSE